MWRSNLDKVRPFRVLKGVLTSKEWVTVLRMRVFILLLMLQYVNNTATPDYMDIQSTLP